MTVQAYFDDADDLIVRVFDRENNRIADLPVSKATSKAADESLSLMKIKRRTKWTRHDRNFLEAQVRFVR